MLRDAIIRSLIGGGHPVGSSRQHLKLADVVWWNVGGLADLNRATLPSFNVLFAIASIWCMVYLEQVLFTSICI